MNSRVFITGYGVITAIGNDGAENLASLLNQRCGFGKLDILETVHRDTLPACEIKLHDHELCNLAGVPDGAGFTRTALLGLIAVHEAVCSAALSPEDIRHAGLISATTTGGIREFERRFRDVQDLDKNVASPAFLDTADPGEHAERLADTLGIRNYIGTVSTACSSSANAIMTGARMIRHGLLDRVICGGTDALSRMTLNGFHSLLILDKEPCRPFDENRRGLNLGEGAAYLVLESETALASSGKKALAELRGYANLNEAFHQTAPSPEGTGALRAMREALERGGLAPDAVDYINAHGTGTENNDLSEGTALQSLFGQRVPPFSSTKPYTGHTMAAAGSVEAAFCLMALEYGVMLPNINFRKPMKELNIRPVTELKHGVALTHILSNSFGFGGGTASLLFSKC